MVEVFFATNRDPAPAEKGHFGERFHPDGPMFFRVGRAELNKVSDDPDDGYDVATVDVFDEKLGADGEEVKHLLGSSKLFADLRARMMDSQRDVLVLIHGFACTFVNSLQRAAQIRQHYLVQPKDGEAYEPHIVVFSWPSNGRVAPPWEFHNDRQDAQASGTAMARFMMRVLEFLSDADGRCAQKIHLVAHSMGNYALRHAVQALILLNEDGNFPTVFTNVFLMAADEDDDALAADRKLARLIELGRSIHVYHHREDEALIISDVTKFNPDRLGSAGPKSFSGLSNRIVAIDCINVCSTRLAHANHQYYRIRPEVIQDVRVVLAGALPDQIPNRVVVESGRRYRIIKS